MTRYRRLYFFGLLGIALAVFFGGTPPAFANILGNPSFESAIGSGTEGNWDSTNGTVRITSPPAGFSAFPDGSAAIQMDVAADFTFQSKRTDIQAGDLVVFTARAESDVPAGSGGQLRIEFQRHDIEDRSENTFILISDVTSALINTDNAPAGGGYVTFTISGRAPEKTAQVTFTLRRQGVSSDGDVVFDNVNGEINPVSLTLDASRTRVRPGDVSTIVANFQNASAQAQSNVELKVEVPAGFDIIENTIRRNGSPTTIREGSTLISATSSLAANDSIRVVFQVLVTTGVSLGKVYEVLATVEAGGRVSALRSITFHIRGDPLFDEGTVLGKVFDDRNEDGVQSKGEIGVGGVRLFTEYGVSIVTDPEGRFHIPAVQPGRHVVKIDGHVLPEGTRFVTEESLVVKTTPGLLSKIRFAVHLPDQALPKEFQKDLQILVTQGVDLTRPELHVRLEPSELHAGLGRLEREAQFQIKTNYGEFIYNWRIEILNEVGERVWTGMGIAQPPAEVPWNGLTDAGEIISPGTYAYRLVVRDSQDREDWTSLQFFRVLRRGEGDEEDHPLEIPETGAFNVFRDGRRAIPLVAQPTVRVYGTADPNRRVAVAGVPVKVAPTGEFEQGLFVKPGKKSLKVTATSPSGDQVTVEEELDIKDSFFFLVALAEEELGINFREGSLETVARDETFHEGFYEAGRLAYYLKAKIKGKFLVKSRYDTSDKRYELFTNLDPDEYYPVYGDYSQIEYEGQETRERLFLLVEMDRSFLKWGSFQTNFTETELSRYSRTLSGLKIHYETLSTTKYGDAKRGFSLFWSKPSYLGDHNEFRATGGSLYYLRNRNVIPGSEKVRVEIREKIQDIPIESRDLVAGKDYEIDYRQGRILLREPLTSVSASETIISNDILDGNPIFLVVDYEFETFRLFEETTAGIRGYTHLGEHIRVGGTAVEEKRANSDYDLRAVDATIRTGRNTKITLELAQSKLQQVRQATSFNGGLSFQNQSPIGIRRPRETAYLIKAESKPLENLDLSGYLQDVQPGFSVDRIKSQEGFRKYGLQARLRMGQSFRLLFRHDSTEVSSSIRPLTLSGLSATFERLRSTTVQGTFTANGWNIIGEYLHQHIDVPLANRVNSFFSETPFGNALGLKVARRVSDQLTPYFKTQFAFSGKNNFQIGGGVEVKVGDQTKVFFEEMIGRVGDATVLGISRQVNEGTTSYATIKVRDFHFGERQVLTSIGSSHQLNERSRIYSEREYSTYSGNLPRTLTPVFLGDPATPGVWSSDIYGFETRLGDYWDLDARFERRHLDADDFRNLSNQALDDLNRANTFNTFSLSLDYRNPKKLKWENALEFRIDPDAPEIRQWLIQELLDWRIHQDLSFLGRFHFGSSRLVEPGDLAGRFVELNTGLAYRPVASDRFNGLLRYTFLAEAANDAQFVGGASGTEETDERAHIFAIEGAYDLKPSLQLVGKLAYRLSSFRTSQTDSIDVGTFLWVQRFNYHVTRKWDLAFEYRTLFQTEAADSFRHGPLIEIDREIYDYVRLGIGYNFTDFDDDLRKSSDFDQNRFFIRLTGKV